MVHVFIYTGETHEINIPETSSSLPWSSELVFVTLDRKVVGSNLPMFVGDILNFLYMKYFMTKCDSDGEFFMTKM